MSNVIDSVSYDQYKKFAGLELNHNNGERIIYESV